MSKYQEYLDESPSTVAFEKDFKSGGIFKVVKKGNKYDMMIFDENDDLISVHGTLPLTATKERFESIFTQLNTTTKNKKFSAKGLPKGTKEYTLTSKGFKTK